jgi:hypothetical protein
LLVPACSSPSPAAWLGPSVPEWRTLTSDLDALRASRPRHPWSAVLHATMREPRSRRVVDARGGIAVAPGRALRMILVTGAGTTLLDAWVTPDRWRIAVPPTGVVRRGGPEEPSDLPVGFLRWWFFTPLGGTLFAAASRDDRSDGGGGRTFLLRDGGAILELHERACLEVRRSRSGRTERVCECKSASEPHPGDRVGYEDESSGLAVDLKLESVGALPPPEESFRDPDLSSIVEGGT